MADKINRYGFWKQKFLKEIPWISAVTFQERKDAKFIFSEYILLENLLHDILPVKKSAALGTICSICKYNPLDYLSTEVRKPESGVQITH